MANVPALQAFADDVNAALNQLLQVRDLLGATDTLWPSLTATVKTNIHNQVQTQLDAAKLLVAALQVP